MRKPVFMLTIAAVVLSAGWLFYSAFMNRPVSEPDPGPSTPVSASMKGEYVCLPHKNTGDPQTLECALGLKAEDGFHYGLKNIDPPVARRIQPGSKISVDGLLLPIGSVQEVDLWKKYDVKGVVEVESVSEQ